MDNQLVAGVVSHIEGSLLYLAALVEEPGTAGLHEHHLMRQHGRGDPVNIRSTIHDARPMSDSSLWTDRIRVLVGDQTAVANFYDEHEVRTVYYLEVERLIKRATGAVKAVVFGHDVRSILKARAGKKGVRAPVAPVHNDYMIKSIRSTCASSWMRMRSSSRWRCATHYDRFDHRPDSVPNRCLDGVRPPPEPFFPDSLPAIAFHRRHLPILACQRVRVFARPR